MICDQISLVLLACADVFGTINDNEDDEKEVKVSKEVVEMSGRSFCLQITSPALPFLWDAPTNASPILYSLPKTEGT